jgi:hypothetical protein
MVSRQWIETPLYIDGDQTRPFKVWYDEVHHCARFWAKGSFNGREAKYMNQVEKQLMDDRGKVHWLIEIGECQFDSEARNVFVEAGKDPRNDKLAFVGLPAPVRFLLSVIARFKGRHGQERQFAAEDRDRAFSWFKESRS